MYSYTIGNTYGDLRNHAELLCSTPQLTWDIIKKAYTSVKRYPLPPYAHRYLKDSLLNCDLPRLWKVNKPSILIYRFSSLELRFFLLSSSRHLCEAVSNLAWYHSFPFIHLDDDAIRINLQSAKTINLDIDVAWLPQTANYSHFLCDSIAPWIPFIDILKLPDKLALLTLNSLSPWQTDVTNILGFTPLQLDILEPCRMAIVKPRSVIFPVISNVVISQVNLRQWLHAHFSQLRLPNITERISPIYLSRSDIRSARIRNSTEIESLVSHYGGTTLDPTKLTFSRKINLLGQASVIICEGSGSLNAILFGNPSGNVIHLTDPLTLQNPLFLDGGFPYLHAISHLTDFVVGKNPLPLQGSPLSSCEFDVSEICNLLDKYRHN